MPNPIDITSLPPDIFATLLSNSFRQKITEEQVRIVAEAGNLLTEDDTVNLLQYTAFLTGTESAWSKSQSERRELILFPSHGQYLGASSIPFSEHKRQKGDRVGHHWRIPGNNGTRAVRHVMIDTNYWKTFIHARLGILMGDPGCLSLFGHDSKRHRLLAEHLTAEYRVRTMAYARTVDEWKNRASRPDNHWLDCLVGCAVAASIQGAELVTFQFKTVITRPRIKLSDRQAFRKRL